MFGVWGWENVSSRAQGKQGTRQGGSEEGKEGSWECDGWEWNDYVILDPALTLFGLFLADEV